MRIEPRLSTSVIAIAIAVFGSMTIVHPEAAHAAEVRQGSESTAPPTATNRVDGTKATVRYRIEPSHSSAGFSMKATLHTVEGKTSSVTGEFSLPAGPTPGGFPVQGRVAIAAMTLDTGNRSRDKRMRSESLAVDRYPQILFEPARAIGNVASFTTGTTASFKLEGDLTIRDVRKPVVLDVTGTFSDKGIVADGEASLSFPDFGVPDPSNFFLHVSTQITVSFHLEASPVP